MHWPELSPIFIKKQKIFFITLFAKDNKITIPWFGLSVPGVQTILSIKSKKERSVKFIMTVIGIASENTIHLKTICENVLMTKISNFLKTYLHR